MVYFAILKCFLLTDNILLIAACREERVYEWLCGVVYVRRTHINTCREERVYEWLCGVVYVRRTHINTCREERVRTKTILHTEGRTNSVLTQY